MESLIIKNFKNIKELSINSLAKVNLITGNNNVGKSTVLEAIYIFANNGSRECFRKLLIDRGELSPNSTYDNLSPAQAKKCVASLFNGRKIGVTPEDGIEIIVDDNYLKIQIEIEDTENKSERKELVSWSCRRRGIVFNVPFSYKELITEPIDNIVSDNNPKINIQQINTHTISKKENALLWDKITMTDSERTVIEALQIVEPKIEALTFIEDDSQLGRVPLVRLAGSDERLHLYSMGDGINRILTIVLALANSKDGILLIDEFENGLHYSVQTKLWMIIFSLAEKLNVQVFATTHSNDCVASFAKENQEVVGQIIRLENKKNKIVPVFYDEDEDIKYIAQKGIEIR